MNVQKKKFINHRPTLTFIVAIIIAIIFSTKIFLSQTSRLIVLCVLVVLGIALLVMLIIKKSRVLGYVFSIVLVMLLPFVSVFVTSESINKNFSLNAEKCEIYGKIYKINENLDKNRVDVYLTDVTLMTTENQLDYQGDFFIRINSNNLDTSQLEIGRFIKGNIKPSFYSLSSGEARDISFISRNITGFAYVYSYNITFTERYDLTLKDRVKSSVYSLFQKTDDFFTNVGYAMMFGDSSVIDDAVYNVFESSGTIHLLAVSGFHVSVIAGCVLFLLRKSKSGKLTTLLVSSAVLIFYAYLCDFSVSIVRATIMSLFILYASMRSKECDRLSSLCSAGCIILLINPLDLFNVSFVLSFISVLSILLLMPIIERLLSKFMYKKFAGALSLSISTSFGLTLFQLYYFGQAPLLSVLSNVITIPIASMLFIFLLIAVVFGSVLGIATPLITMFGYGMKYVLQFNNWVAGLGLYLQFNHVREIALLISVLLMFVISDYLFVKRKSRIIIANAVCVVLALLLIF